MPLLDRVYPYSNNNYNITNNNTNNNNNNNNCNVIMIMIIIIIPYINPKISRSSEWSLPPKDRKTKLWSIPGESKTIPGPPDERKSRLLISPLIGPIILP